MYLVPDKDVHFLRSRQANSCDSGVVDDHEDADEIKKVVRIFILNFQGHFFVLNCILTEIFNNRRLKSRSLSLNI